MSAERANAVTLKGTPFTLVGPELKVGDKAPDFETVGKDLKPLGLADTRGSVRIFSVVPSLDTPVCDAQTRRFNEEAAQLSDVKIYTISMDLPFAQGRWCAASGVEELTMLIRPSKCPVRNSLRYPQLKSSACIAERSSCLMKRTLYATWSM